jgi:C4-type Zn-finger protein
MWDSILHEGKAAVESLWLCGKKRQIYRVTAAEGDERRSINLYVDSERTLFADVYRSQSGRKISLSDFSV